MTGGWDRASSSLFDWIPDVVFVAEVVDGDVGGFVDANLRAGDRLGYSPADLGGLRLRDLVFEPAEIVDGWLDHLLRTSRGRFSCTVRSASGARVPLEVESALSDDRALAIFMGRDASARLELERAQGVQVETLHSVLDALPSSVFILSPAGHVIDCNQPGRDDLAAHDVSAGVALWDSGLWSEPEARDAVREMIRAAADGTPGRIEHEIDVGDGSRRAVDLAFVPLVDADGEVTHVVGTALDVTGRAVLELASAGEEVPETFEAASDARGWVGADGCWLSGSPQLAELLGTTASELQGRPAWDVLDESDQPIVSSQLDRLLQGEIPIFSTEHRIVRGDGEEIAIRLIASSFPEREGEVVVMLEDVTDRRDKTLVLAEETRRLHDVKRSLLANVSHEIRTPMNAVLGLTRLALRDVDSEPARGYLETSLASAEQLMRLLQDILDVSKAEQGTFDLRARVFDLALVIEAACAPFRKPAKDKGVKLGVELLPGLPERVVGDPDRFRQVVTNLVSNAVKFTDRGTVDVRLSPAGDGASEEIDVVVEDTGVGIPREDLDRIFEPFEQVDTSTTRRVGGTGLGLAIVSELTKVMGGELDVDSSPGRGTRFRIRLPLVARRDAEAPSGGEGATPRSEGDMPEVARGLDVLVVDDTSANRVLAEALLSRRGHTVTVASSGEEALERLRATAFDVVLMDVQMPVMDGFEVTRRLRRREEEESLARTPIVAMTAHAMRGDREQCLAAGMDSYLTKPIDARELVTVVEILGDRPPAAHPVREAEAPTLDLDAARSRLADDDELLREMIRMFLEDAPRRIDALERGEGVRREAHTLKGQAATVGAEALRRVAAKIEEQATSDGENVALADIARELRGAFGKAEAALRAYLSEA